MRLTTARRFGTAGALLALYALSQPPDALAAERPDLKLELPVGATEAVPAGTVVDSQGQVASQAPVPAMIELIDAPAALVYAREKVLAGKSAAAAAGIAHRSTIRKSQQTVAETIRARGISVRELYRVQRAFNGIAVEVAPEQMAAIARIPGVKSVRPLAAHFPDNAGSVPFVGAPAVWDGGGSNARGEGTTIAVIDSGIDYIHRNFGGDGDYSGQDPTRIDDLPGAFPNAKVVGGWDFIDNDPDPFDCELPSGSGHGTHVAGTAGGYGVKTDGSTYGLLPGEDYDATTDFSTLRIGPGVAPLAQLYAFRVFNCAGSTTGGSVAIVAAIDRALDPDDDGDMSDRVDVINMSLGAVYGSPDDPSTAATDNAVAAGVVVVVSAGNSGDTYFISGSPGTAARAITVAASVDGGMSIPAFRVNSPGAIAGDYPFGPAGFGPALTDPGITQDVVLAVDDESVAPGDANDACSPLTPASAADVLGAIALVNRGACNFTIKVANAQDAGALAVLVGNTSGGIFGGLGGSDPTITIPSGMIEFAVSELIKANLPGANATVAASVQIPTPEVADTIGSFTSRGPSRDGAALKPDIAAPGVNIGSTSHLTGDQGKDFNGTSMAAPHVAGSMAILRQIHPDWTPEELKALITNNASHDLFQDVNSGPPRFSPARVGVGRLDLAAAATPGVLALVNDGSGRVSVSFGLHEVTGVLSTSRTVQVLNDTLAAVDYDLAYVGIADIPGVEIATSVPSISVPAMDSATFELQLSADASLMNHSRDAAVAATQTPAGSSPGARNWLSEESGYLTLTPNVGPVLRIAAHAAARPAAAMGTLQSSLDLPVSGNTLQLDLDGVEIFTGNALPTDIWSLVTVLELAELSADDPSSTGNADAADLQALGVGSTYRSGTFPGTSNLVFGFATHGDWDSLNNVEFDVNIDTDEDGDDDFVIFNFNRGQLFGLSGSSADDAYVSVLCALQPAFSCISAVRTNGFDPSVIDSNQIGNSVVFFFVPAADLGLSEADSNFNYQVSTFSRDAAGLVDFSGIHAYDAMRPGLRPDLSGALNMAFPMFGDFDDTPLMLGFDPAGYAFAGSSGVLLLHHHNAAGQRAQVLPMPQLGTGIFADGLENLVLPP